MDEKLIMFDPLVSIITPSYNQGFAIEKTIRSVLDQSYKKIEYIIVDGNSKDETPEILKKYSSKINHIISEPDEGQADAINKGLQLAKGDLLCWINSDDIMYFDFIQNRVNQFKIYPEADLIYGDVEQGVSPEKKTIRRGKQTSFPEMLTTATVGIPQQSAVWKATILEKTGYLQTRWHVLLDRDLFMKIAFFGNIRYCEGVTGFFYNHPSSKSMAREMEWINELKDFYPELFETFLDKEFARYKKQALGNMNALCAKIASSNHYSGLYITHTWRAFRYYPPAGLRALKYINLFYR